LRSEISVYLLTANNGLANEVTVTTYNEYFRIATGNPQLEPFPYQRRLAEAQTWPSILDVPTGLGKTEAIVLAWLYRRHADVRKTPRRLVYVLPQRTLVEQTVHRAEALLARLCAAKLNDDIAVEMLMGGEVGAEWISAPEAPRLLVGTQDMLLSRALNRGYAMSRFQWPMAFAWLHADALWVLDEVQLQGVGVTTAAQLQGFRNRLGTVGATATMFASATIDRSWIDTVDHPISTDVVAERLQDDDRHHPVVRKRLEAKKRAHRLDAYDPKELAAQALSLHRPGTRTLVIVNTVERAVQTFQAIQKARPHIDVTLLHSRYRPADRQAHLERALAPIDVAAEGRVVVATQVVEAGVDFSATTLLSDVAPWSSIVQRLGRCNRTGDDVEATFGWVEPPELTAANSRPYALADVRAARETLLSLEERDLAPGNLPRVALALEPSAVLRRVDLLELFDTTADLTGSDIDVSRFIRDADDFSVFVAWRERPPEERDEVRRQELCPAPKADVEKILKRLADERKGDMARVSRVASDEGWSARATPGTLRTGEIVWLSSDVGGYDTELGFRIESRTPVPEISREPLDRADVESETLDADVRTFIGEAIDIATHAEETAVATRDLMDRLVADGLVDDRLRDLVVISARWHDVGKAHPVFQRTLRGAVGDGPGPWAKSDGTTSRRHERPGFRHEVASAIAWLAANDGKPDADLVAYLVMAHHGKVRLTAQRLPVETPAPGQRLICGIADDDQLPAVDLGSGTMSVACHTSLALFDVGSSSDRPTWSDRTAALVADREIGPFRLAFLESLVRVADWRASALHSNPRRRIR